MSEPEIAEEKPKGYFAKLRAYFRKFFGLRSYLELGKVRSPLLICFDHMFSEYRTVRSQIIKTDPIGAEFIDGLEGRREKTLSWSDLYHFQLILAEALPREQLRTKIPRLRFDYRSVAGEKEFDDYMASKPPDLQSPPQPTDDTSEAHYEKLLRDDLKDLLGRMYLEYAILPVREERLTDLTWIAARLCLFSLLSLLGILALLFLVPLAQEINEAKGDFFFKFNVLVNSERLAALTVFVVVVSGAMGGFVSALRRIQSPSTEGDSLYNLSLLFHGSYSVFVAPISGAIFAIILYLLFTAGTLKGTFFPEIYTPPGKYAKVESADVHHLTPTLSPSLGTPKQDEIARSDGSAEQNPSPTPTPTPDEKATTGERVSKSEPVPEQGMNVFDFLARSGPGSGKDYALLIVWCFIAGFAERFVPDALDRLVRGSSTGKRT